MRQLVHPRHAIVVNALPITQDTSFRIGVEPTFTDVRAAAMVKKAKKKKKSASEAEQNFVLDDTDWQILNMLRIDGRASYGTIGKKIGLSETATRHRVNRMTKASICQITVTINPRRIGLDAVASLGFHIEGPTAPVLKQLATIPEVAFLAKTFGTYDIVAEIFCSNMDELSAIVEKKVRKIDGVKKIDVNIITDMPKFIVNPMIASPA